jgi:hypothetical protein
VASGAAAQIQLLSQGARIKALRKSAPSMEASEKTVVFSYSKLNCEAAAAFGALVREAGEV